MANPNTQVAASFTNHFNELIKREFLENYRSTLILEPLGMASVHPLNQGDTARWLKIDDLSADPANSVLTDGTTPDGQSLTDSNVEATLVQYGDYVTISDKFKNIAVGDIQAKVANIIARQAAQVVDTLVRNELNATTNNHYTGANASISDVNTNTTELSSSDLKKMVTILRNANVPVFADGHYRGVLHPFMEQSLMNETGASDYIILAANNGSGGSAIEEAEIGKAFGIRLMRTTQIQSDATFTNVYENIFLGRDAFGTTTLANNNVEIITKPFGSGGDTDALDQRMTVGWKTYYVAKILQAAGVRSLHAYGV